MKLTPYLVADKLRVDVTEIDLKFDSEPRIYLRTSTDALSTDSAGTEDAAGSNAFEEIIGSFGRLIKEHMRAQIHSELSSRFGLATKNVD